MAGQTMLDAHVRGYAQAVRLHLADLGPDAVEDLAGGLEADLADAVADRALLAADATDADATDDVALDLTKVFGPPARYAAELRAAAGFPAPAVVAPRRGRLRSVLRSALRARRTRVAAAWWRAWEPLTATPAWRAVREVLVELTPVWWVARGWLVGAFLASLFGGRGRFSVVPLDGGALAVVAVVVVVSVQWGRGRWMPWRWVPTLAGVASVVALVALLPMSFATRDQVRAGDGSQWSAGYASGLSDAGSGGAAQGGQVSWGAASPSGQDGVWVDGMQVSNLFAYDANGDPLRDVQLFDDRGRPVRTVPVDAEWQRWSVPDVEGRWIFRPGLATDGRARWNVFPLSALPEKDVVVDDSGQMKPAVGARAQQQPWPFLKAPTVIEQSAPKPSAGAPTEPDATTQDPDAPATEAPETPAPTEAPETPAPTAPPGVDAPTTPPPAVAPSDGDGAPPAGVTSADGA
ncbi:hypothetical protein [Xylanimonas protaetiae]|uniref:Uncharacterized protein n=1 Tax=Xylanimonas protaetiae TaxID=2509457 RepID=A0A4P6F0N2_9MICO|nr:hypothetical protein [Xylanimonas protaetiae]QAY68994.1 hypothetical protein ET471_02175 [Xylanimonas protaetiae]